MVRIFLTGYMGAGKTTLGKAFARELGLSFIDLDWYIEERFRKTISQLFAERGEDGFRRLERDLLHEAGEFEDVVISTGGGTPCFFDNMDYMNIQGKTVFLDVDVETLFRRLRVATQQRPILRGKSDEELLYLITEHTSFYERYGWEYLCMVMGDDGEPMRMYRSPSARSHLRLLRYLITHKISCKNRL